MTDRYAVIGHPVAHSKSPQIHSAFAQGTGQDIDYTRLEAPLDAFAAVASAFRDGGGKGLNVTVPFKLQAAELATDRHEAVRIAGAANALKFSGNRIEAENFDGVGLVRDIEHNLGLPLGGRRVLVLGAGGAGSAIVISMLEAGAAEVAVHDVDGARADKIVGLLQGRFEGRVRAASGDPTGFDVVSNATPMGMADGDPLPLDPAKLAPSMFVGDVVAGHGETPLIKAARAAGCRVADGDAMVVAVLDVMCDFVLDAWK